MAKSRNTSAEKQAFKQLGVEPGEAIAAEPVYVVVNPITYGAPEQRHETGAEVSDIPAASIQWLLEQGHITLKGAQS